MRYANFALFAAIVMLSNALLACQSNPPAVTDTPTQQPSVTLQTAPDQGQDNSRLNNSTVDNSRGSHGAHRPVTEIPLITKSNRPVDQPDAFIPPYDRLDNPANIEASWRQPAIAKTETDAVYLREWAKSQTKGQCPLLALPVTAHAHIPHHNARRANFSGGWGVAYDLPNERSAYGVAHSGISDPLGQSSIWQDYHLYDDGTELTYGREGGNPDGHWLAYLTLGGQYSPSGQHCFYNIWSQQSKQHLEQIIKDLRQVAR